MDATLSLDPATVTGWALLMPDGRIQHGHISFAREGHEREGAPFLRLHRFLVDTNTRVNGEIRALYFEDPGGWFPQGRANAAKTLLAMRGVILAWAERNKIAYLGVSPMTLKKDATGNAKADKAAMVKAVNAWGGTFAAITDHNEADATALLLTRPAVIRALQKQRAA